jgi:cytochrome c biogenesis protein CcdA
MPLLLAASSSTQSVVSRLQQIPLMFWLGLAAAVVGLIILVLTLQRLARGNRAILAIVAGMVVSFVGFSWIYERNEPAWATPAVNFLSGYFPTKVKIEQHKAGI